MNRCFYIGLAIFTGLWVLSAQVSADTNAADMSAITSHAITMHGKPKYPADFAGFEYTSANAVKGGQLRLGVQGTFDSLNPYIAKGTPGDYISLIYDSLTVSASDEAFSRYGLVAETIELPEDRSWVIYNLRRNAKFHDGKALTAEDVVFSFNLLMEKGSPFFQSYYREVKSVEALNLYKVKFSFANTDNRELALIVGELPILPKHFWQDLDFDKSTLDIPLGSGPYQIHSVEQGRKLVFKRNKNYWGQSLAVNRGTYNFDTIQVDYYKDAVVLLEALKAGQFDFRLENSAKQWATGYTGNAIDSGKLVKKEIPHQIPTGMQSFVLNLRKPIFQDIKVRQALNYAFDFEWSNKNLFYDAYTRTHSYFSNSELASSGIPTGREKEILLAYQQQLPDSIFTEPFTLPTSKGNGHNRANLRTAMKLLKQAGWHVKNNQLVNARGEVFRFEIMLAQPTFERVVNPYVKTLKKLGIEATVRHVEVSQYINRIRNFDFDIIVGGIGQSLSPGNEQIEFWHSSRVDQPGSRNRAGIANPVIDDLIALVVAAPNREELIARTRALDRVLLSQHYMIPQWYLSSHRIAYWDKFKQPDVSPKYDPGYQQGLWTWWLDSNANIKAEQP